MEALVRGLEANGYLMAHPAEACPAKWKQGAKTQNKVAASKSWGLMPVMAGGAAGATQQRHSALRVGIPGQPEQYPPDHHAAQVPGAHWRALNGCLSEWSHGWQRHHRLAPCVDPGHLQAAKPERRASHSIISTQSPGLARGKLQGMAGGAAGVTQQRHSALRMGIPGQPL